MKLFNIFKKKKIKTIPNKTIDEALHVTNEDKPLLARQEYGIHIRKNPPKNKSLLAAQKYGETAKHSDETKKYYDEAAKGYKEAANYYANIANEKLISSADNTIEEENSL